MRGRRSKRQYPRSCDHTKEELEETQSLRSGKISQLLFAAFLSFFFFRTFFQTNFPTLKSHYLPVILCLGVGHCEMSPCHVSMFIVIVQVSSRQLCYSCILAVASLRSWMSFWSLRVLIFIPLALFLSNMFFYFRNFHMSKVLVILYVLPMLSPFVPDLI